MRDYSLRLLNAPVDVSGDFLKMENEYFLAWNAASFDPETGAGELVWKRHRRAVRNGFGIMNTPFAETEGWEFPPGEYPTDYTLPFSVEYVTPRTVRVRVAVRTGPLPEEESLMLLEEAAAEPGREDVWETGGDGDETVYRLEGGTVTVRRDPWRIEFRDPRGRLLTGTQHVSDTFALMNSDPLPFSFVRRAEDHRRRLAAVFSLAPGERIYGAGESFTRLDKRGQKVVLWATDTLSVQTGEMYKPIPFFMSSRGYGMFVHTSAPATFDFGYSYDAANIITLGDEHLDLYFFFGGPKEILAEYTALTGRAPVPPLWSFGLWMSRLTYWSEIEGREVARRFREEEVPCDVIHYDTGWFETEWRCDYRFSTERFADVPRFLSELRREGFRVSVWQQPYFNPNNPLYREAMTKGYAVLDADGALPGEDVIVDMSNPDAVKWYQDLLAGVLKLGVSAIKADFGEAAPLTGVYASGKSGFFEHNLYPLRYNRAVMEVTREITGDSIIWARSAWAGSQRCPVHWGGDAENTGSAMLATLRAGLSLGLCGFTFWSHDIGGFVRESPRELYRRWMPFGMLASHSRCHGLPPKEPWAYDEEFTADFRRAAELKYRLMPYIYAQSVVSARTGLPMLRALFLEYPDDPGSWTVEDQYLLGSDLMVAPLFEETDERAVWLPPGFWHDYQTGRTYPGGRFHTIRAGEIPVVLLVRDGAAIPHIGLAQSTAFMDWSRIELRVFAEEAETASALFALPEDNALHTLFLEREGWAFQLAEDPLGGKVMWEISVAGE